MGVAELRRLKQLEDENRKIKQWVVDLTLDKHMLQDVLKKVVKPAQQRPMVQYHGDLRLRYPACVSGYSLGPIGV
jgi:putative transposase